MMTMGFTIWNWTTGVGNAEDLNRLQSTSCLLERSKHEKGVSLQGREWSAIHKLNA